MMKLAAILLSRQSLRPTRDTTWVLQSIKAVNWVESQSFKMISSVGMQTWEMTTSLASLQPVPLNLILPSVDSDQFIQECEDLIYQFKLKSSRVNFETCSPNRGSEDKLRSLEHLRDQTIIDKADILIPVSIRPGGSLEKRLAEAVNAGKLIDRRFQIKYEKKQSGLKLDYSKMPTNQSLKTLPQNIIHWTRGISKTWLNERKIDYYKSILQSDRWLRSGFGTLSRIIESKMILASSRNMPGDIATVSYSSLSPLDVIPLMRWRARFGAMSFEPYGIGIDYSQAMKIGIRQVKYYDKSDHRDVLDNDDWLTQSIGKITNWQKEQEYRYRGDFHFESIPKDAITLFCASYKEAEKLQTRFGFRTYPLFDI